MSKPDSDGVGKPSAVYVVDTPAGAYAGRTEIGQGETPRQAVKARLDEHIRDDSGARVANRVGGVGGPPGRHHRVPDQASSGRG